MLWVQDGPLCVFLVDHVLFGKLQVKIFAPYFFLLKDGSVDTKRLFEFLGHFLVLLIAALLHAL